MTFPEFYSIIFIMNKVLLIEDSKTLANILMLRIETELNFETVWADSYSAAEKVITKEGHDFFIALIDLNLPDAPEMAALNFALSKEIPSVVITANFDENIRDMCSEKMLIDFVLKEGPYSIDYMVSLIQRIYLNKSVKILVVDDSASARAYIGGLLQVHQYNVIA